MKELIAALIALIVGIPALALAYANSQIVNALLGVIWNNGGWIGIIVVLIVVGMPIYKKYY